MFGQHIQNIASFFGTFDVSLPFAGTLSDKLGRRISVLIGAASYVIFFIGIAFSPNIQVAYVAAVLGGIAIGILGVLAIFAPMPAGNAAAKSESFISSLKNANFSVESIALILITSIATFQLWLNCAQTFGKEIAGIPSASVSMMQTYYSAGTMVALVGNKLTHHKVQTDPFPGDLPGDFRCHVGSGLPGENTDDLLRGSICDRLCNCRRCPSDGNSNSE